MATTTGSSGIVKVAASGGTVAVVGEVRSYTFDGTADTIEDSVMGDSARSYKAGLKTNTLTVECYWDEADTQQALMDERVSVDFELYPTGTGTGETYFSGSGIVTSRSVTASFDGMVEASFSIQCSGAVTEATA
jgi:predicted secreted protein